MRGKPKLYFVLIFLLFSVLLLGFSKAGTTWSLQTVYPIAGVYYDSLALDSSGNPHISFEDSTKGALTYGSWNGSAWTFLALPSTSNVSYNDLALDSNGYPHISYFEATRGDLMYASWNGVAWITQTVDATGTVGIYNSLALDSKGYPRISYCEPDKGDLKYANWTGTSWSVQTLDSTGDVGYYNSLALDSNGNPRISYRDGSLGDLKYASWNGAAWTFQIVDSTGNVGYDTSLALDSSGNPRISYLDATNGHLKYASLSGSAWTFQIVDSSTDTGLYTSLALDSNGYPHISYYDATLGDLRYASWNGAAWITQTVDSTGDVGYFTSLALGSNGNPHISYRDQTNGILKYASGQPTPPTGSIDINSGNQYTTSKSVTLSLTSSATGVSVHDVRFSNDGVWDTETWEPPVASKAWILTSDDGPKTVYYQVRDDDLMSSSVYSGSIKLDTTPPTGSVIINSGASSTNSTLVTLTLSATDATSGVGQMGFSNDGSTYIWQTYSSSSSWTLPGGDGAKTVYAKFKDNAGLESTVYSATMTLITPTPPPALVASATPATLSVKTGETATFVASASGGTSSYNFQWFEGSAAMAGQIQQTLSVSKNNAGSYSFYCKVTDSAAATINTNTVTLTVTTIPPPPPTLSASATPKTPTVEAGQSATFAASASGGTSPYTYQWYEGSAAMTGQTQTTLSVTKNTAETYTFYCKVTDSAGATVNTNSIILTVSVPPHPPSAPAIVFTSSVGNGSEVKSSSLQLTWKAENSSEVDHYEVKLDDGTWTNIKSQTSYTFNGLTDGTHTFNIKPVGEDGLSQTYSIKALITTGGEPLPLWWVLMVVAIIVVATILALLLLKFFRKRPKLRLRAKAEPVSLVANGSAKSIITLQLVDQKGKPIAALADTPIRVTATKGKLESPVVTIPKGRDSEKTILVSSTETGPAPVSVNAEGLKSITITLNFTEKSRYCMHCGTQLAANAKVCQNCGLSPPAGEDTKVCQNCEAVIPVVAKFCSECGAGQQI